MSDNPAQVESIRKIVSGEMVRRVAAKYGSLEAAIAELPTFKDQVVAQQDALFEMCCEAIWALAISDESLSMLLGDATPPIGMLAPSLAPILPELVKLAKERKGE